MFPAMASNYGSTTDSDELDMLQWTSPFAPLGYMHHGKDYQASRDGNEPSCYGTENFYSESIRKSE